MSLKASILEILFPSYCFICKKEGDYLCQDCKSVLEISRSHKRHNGNNLSDLYFALSYQNPFVKDLIRNFKYEPFVKELGKPLSSLIIEHLNLIDNKPDFTGFILVPVPIEKGKLKWRGFNQAEELAKELAIFLEIPVISDALVKIKRTPNQTDLSEEERKENIKNAFFCQIPEKIKGKKIIIVDDFFCTGSTLEECSRALKEAGAYAICGIVIARE